MASLPFDPSTAAIEILHRYLGAVSADEIPDLSSKAESPSRGTYFSIWSPLSKSVQIQVANDGARHSLDRLDSGYHVATLGDLGIGDDYQIILDQGPPLPDPVSRFQPAGVHGPSRVIDRRFAWTDESWLGVERDDWIIYELHVGTFTDGGTFDSAIARLDELVSLGITAIELMPLADAAGRWNWGYDGVNLFAPNRNYGTPDDVRRFVDAAHAKGLAVFLDVVYNHLGPEGHYLGGTRPYLSSHHHTVWGSAPNFDDPEYGRECRRIFIANAIYWLDEFHFDGLRVDAIHCMKDDSDEHVVIEMSRAIRAWQAESGRPACLIAESNVYDADMLSEIADGGVGFDAQWSDDFVHSLLATLRPGEKLCHRDYEPATDLDQTLRVGYVYAGTLAGDRGREPVTEPVATEGLIRCIQNHDFIGNHPLGERLSDLTSPQTQRAAATLMMLLPSVPMLFMGEEFACPRPFQFFVDFGDEHLRQSVIAGRQREYPQHDWSGGTLPTDEAAFRDSRIGPIHDQEMWNFYRELIEIRKRWRAAGFVRDQTMQVSSDLAKHRYSVQYDLRRCDIAATSTIQPLSNRPVQSVGIVVELVTQGSPNNFSDDWPHLKDGARWILDSANGSPESHSRARLWECESIASID